MLNETGFKTPLLLNYTQWENGQTGSVGMFSANGSTTENYRVLADDPWGKQTVVWEARPDATSDTDGGWNASHVAVDPNYYYRFSIWVRRPVVGNGSTYFGCYGSPAVLMLGNGASNTNAYFWAGGFGYTDWVLIVGHIHPQGTPAGSAMHPDSGFYRVGDGRIGNTSSDFIFANGTTTAAHRSYLFYSTDTNTRQQWVYPRMDKCDGTEPSIADLLAGHDSRSFEHIKRLNGSTKQAMSIDTEIKVGGISEVGITNGLVAYYPLNKDAKDYSGNGYHGTVTGATLTGGGYDGTGAYRFDGVDDYIGTGNIPFYTSATVSYWVKLNQLNKLQFVFGKNTETGVNLTLHGISSANRPQINVLDSDLLGATSITSGVWYYIAGTYEYDGSNTIQKIYLNGLLDGTKSVSGAYVDQVSTKTQIGMEWDSSTAGSDFTNGDICNVKIFNRALSAEEIMVEYKRTGPTKMTQHNGTVYIQGQVKEI